ncbi:MAG: hypothetical protein JWM46_877 [Candidatus Kaiserbacteria bacterium]|nr:hypothetical protein [Candidatus Kaiserbacteria bacterium]
MEFQPNQESRIRMYFRISIFLKGVVSLLEIIGGVLALFIPVSAVTAYMVRLAEGELSEDGYDFIATHLIQLAHSLSVTGGLFIGIYLLSRGLIKLVLVVALLKNQLWAYPSSLAVLGLFVLYQAYEILHTHSVFLIALTLFDLLVMWFIWREYEVLRSHVVRP